MKKQRSKSIVETFPFKHERVGYLWEDRLMNYQVWFAILLTVLFVLFAFGFLAFTIRTVIFGLFLKQDSFASINDPNMIVGILLGIFVPYQLAHTIFNQFPGMRISQRGLEVQIFDYFHYTWHFVPWAAVQAVYPVVKFGWFPESQLQPMYIIEVDNLSAWHRMFSFMFGNGHLHALVINPNFPRAEMLLNQVRNYLSERDIESMHKVAG